jgi:hypothetical protein
MQVRKWLVELLSGSYGRAEWKKFSALMYVHWTGLE